MKMRVQVLTDEGEEIGRMFDTPILSYWLAITAYRELIKMLTGSQPED